MTTLLLLAPGTPLLFQGQEFCADVPFLYFADHEEPFALEVLRGRAEFLAQFPSIGALDRASLDAPHERATFERCKLDFLDRKRHAAAYALHKDLLKLRRDDSVIARGDIDGFVLNDHAFAVRYAGEEIGDIRLLVINLGPDLAPSSIADPLIAPPEGREWKLLLSTDDPRYGGSGGYVPCVEGHWRIPGEAAVLLTAAPA